MATLDEKVDGLREDVSEIKVALKGYNGQKGLCERHDDLAKDYYRFKQWVMGIFIFLVGSGAIGVSAVKIIQLINSH